MWESLNINFRTFWLGEPKCIVTYLKKSQFVPFGANLNQFGAISDIPGEDFPSTQLQLFKIINRNTELLKFKIFHEYK